MAYSVRIKRSAIKDLERLPGPDRVRIVAAIDRLARHPLEGAVLKGALRGLRRIGVGRYRVIYELQDDALIVLVVRVAGRGEAYRGVIA